MCWNTCKPISLKLGWVPDRTKVHSMIPVCLSMKVMGLQDNYNLCNGSVEKLHEIAQMCDNTREVN